MPSLDHLALAGVEACHSITVAGTDEGTRQHLNLGRFRRDAASRASLGLTAFSAQIKLCSVLLELLLALAFAAASTASGLDPLLHGLVSGASTLLISSVSSLALGPSTGRGPS